MSEFIVIWLLVVIENIAMLLSTAGEWFTPLLLVFIVFTLAPNILADNKEKADIIQERIKKPRKWVVVMLVCSLFLGTLGALLPTKKELAIIIGAGATYKILTSDEAKQIGGKSIELVNQKLDEWAAATTTATNVENTNSIEDVDDVLKELPTALEE